MIVRPSFGPTATAHRIAAPSLRKSVADLAWKGRFRGTSRLRHLSLSPRRSDVVARRLRKTLEGKQQ